MKRECEAQYDYTPFAAFRSVDRFNGGRIDTVNLGDFLRRNACYSTDMELLAMVRRIDTDGDANITYSEFAEFIRPIIPFPRPPAPPVYVPPPRYSSPQRPSSASLSASAPLRS